MRRGRSGWSGLPVGVRWAFGAGFVLRLSWALSAWFIPRSKVSDASNYLSMATQMSRGESPSIGGMKTAFFPPGYSVILTPAAWVERVLGGPPLAFWAAMINVVAGTVTILLVYLLGCRVVGSVAAAVGSALVAFNPVLVALAAAALADTVFVCLLVGAWLATLALCDQAAEAAPAGPKGRAVWWIALGGGIAAVALVRAHGLALLPVVALAQLTAIPWRDATRRFALTLIGVAGVCAPWMVRNGLQVGVWTPISTNNAAFACLGNQDGVSGGYADSKSALLRCFDGSVFANPDLYVSEPDLSAASRTEIGVGDFSKPPDEPRWYGETMSTSANWVSSHPRRVVALAVNKLAILVFDSPDAFEAASDDGGQPTLAEPAERVVSVAAYVAQIGTLVAALVTLWLRVVPSSWRLWAPTAVLIALVVSGIALPRFMASSIPFVALLAAPALLRVARLVRFGEIDEAGR